MHVDKNNGKATYVHVHVHMERLFNVNRDQVTSSPVNQTQLLCFDIHLLSQLVCPLHSTCITCTFVPVSMQKEERERVGGEGRRERGEGMVM